nr:centrosomal protein of 112 kDa [Chlorocebus sabaeus]
MDESPEKSIFSSCTDQGNYIIEQSRCGRDFQAKKRENQYRILQDELENRSNQVRCAEKKLQHKELESQEQITYIRQEYETKLKGLMPASLRQELEDTISSLKSQVNFLQKRASILQEELTTYQGRR